MDILLVFLWVVDFMSGTLLEYINPHKFKTRDRPKPEPVMALSMLGIKGLRG